MTLSEFIENYNIDISMYEFFTLDKLINMSATNSKIALEVSAYMLARAKNQIATHARLSPVECIKWAGAAMTISDVLYKKYEISNSYDQKLLSKPIIILRVLPSRIWYNASI